MKTNYISSLLALSLMIIISCKKELEPQDNSSVVTPSITDSTSKTPVSQGLISTSQNTTLQQQNTNSNSSGMNPPHGQPGHRCEIAVGAPLNSPPGKLATVPNSSVPNPGSKATAPLVIKSNTPAVVAKPGMNPAHGQAGHRCDIAVGAPLNSPSSKTVPATTNTESNPQVPTLLKLDSTATSPN